MNSDSASNLPWHRLLGREPARFDPAAWPYLTGQCVLVTGAGGSIGSALAQAVLAADARRVILFDSSEQALYRIESALSELGLIDRAHLILGSVLDEALVEHTLDRFRPAIVFHAAAFKHVALMEAHPFAALKNNTLGTYIVARCAARFTADRFVLVSTDKAVNPTSIMGASKRLAELLVASLAGSTTRLSSVRLGNVLGSEGSVAPKFVQQIKHDGPVTVTDPAATRYFFTLEETVDLILSAGALDSGGAIVVPEFTQPVNIAALAQFLIAETAGKDQPIAIEFTGLRPGEKLNEELCSADELLAIEHKAGRNIVPPTSVPSVDPAHLIEELRSCLREHDLDLLLRFVRRYVSEYRASAAVRECEESRIP